MDFESPKSSKAAGAIRVDYELYRKEPGSPDGLATLSASAISSSELAAVVHRNVAALVAAQIDLPRPRNFLLGIEQHLLPLRDPTGRPRNREQYREHRHGEAHGLVNESRVEVNVGIKLALDEIIVLQRDSFALQRDVDQRIASHYVEHFIRDVLHNFRARIVVLVDAVAEPHQLLLTRLDLLDVVRNTVHRGNFEQHPQNRFVRAAMQRAV